MSLRTTIEGYLFDFYDSYSPGFFGDTYDRSHYGTFTTGGPIEIRHRGLTRSPTWMRSAIRVCGAIGYFGFLMQHGPT